MVNRFGSVIHCSIVEEEIFISVLLFSSNQWRSQTKMFGVAAIKIEKQPLFDRNVSCDIMAFDIAVFVSNCDSCCINNI